jgi:uncharacterized protein involved in exopolysaccharide biosynthesis
MKCNPFFRNTRTEKHFPFHNLQQLSDAVDALQGASSDDAKNAAAFLVSQIQPLVTRIQALETAVADLQTQLKTLKG